MSIHMSTHMSRNMSTHTHLPALVVGYDGCEVAQLPSRSQLHPELADLLIALRANNAAIRSDVIRLRSESVKKK